MTESMVRRCAANLALQPRGLQAQCFGINAVARFLVVEGFIPQAERTNL